MSALLAAFGAKALTYAGLVVAGVLGLFLTSRSIKSSGEDKQRAADTQKELDDVTAATKARSGVDGLGDAAVDDELRRFQRK